MVTIIFITMAFTMLILVIMSAASALKKLFFNGENTLKDFKRHLKEKSQTRRAIHFNHPIGYHH